MKIKKKQKYYLMSRLFIVCVENINWKKLSNTVSFHNNNNNNDDAMLKYRHHKNKLALGDSSGILRNATDEVKKKRKDINKKYVEYHEHLKFMLTDAEFKHIKIFNWGR